MGTKTEALCDELFATNGFTKYPSKYGSNNGFDGVYIKMNGSTVEEIIINEAKQISATGAMKLNPQSSSGLGAQMSDSWISQVILQMQNNVDQDLKNLGNLLDQNISKIKKTVTGVDRSTGEIAILRLNNY